MTCACNVLSIDVKALSRCQDKIRQKFNWYFKHIFLRYYFLPLLSRILYHIFKCKIPPINLCVSIQYVCVGFSWRFCLAIRMRSAASVCTTSTSSCVLFGAMKRPSAVLKPRWQEELAPTKEPLDGPTAEPASALFSILIPASPCGNTAS